MIHASGSGDPAYVEIINFDTVAVDDVVKVMIADVENPTNARSNLRIGVLTFIADGKLANA